MTRLLVLSLLAIFATPSVLAEEAMTEKQVIVAVANLLAEDRKRDALNTLIEARETYPRSTPLAERHAQILLDLNRLVEARETATSIRPPSISQKRWVMARPRPVPP